MKKHNYFANSQSVLEEEAWTVSRRSSPIGRRIIAIELLVGNGNP